MTSIKENLRIWDSSDHWENGTLGNGQGLDEGEKWSRAWGNSEAQWNITLLPRVEKYLNSKRVLEIAPGRGRWTQYLKDYCTHLTVVDLSENCIEYCRNRFEAEKHISYFVNDGRTLDFIEDKSIDFIFSFDSMVHVDAEDLSSYVAEFSRILAPNGVAFIHHSNRAKYGSIESNPHLRSPNVSADSIRDFAREAGLSIVQQECVPWSPDNAEEGVMLDCMTTLSKGIRSDAIPNPIDNERFLHEQTLAKEWLEKTKSL